MCVNVSRHNGRYFPNEPFILKGAAKKDAAYNNWKSDDYIVKNFGHYKAKAENKNEDRLTDYCGMQKLGVMVDCPRTVKPYEETYINISRFMKHYRKPGYDKYIITQLPDGMADEVSYACFPLGKRSTLNLGIYDPPGGCRPSVVLRSSPRGRQEVWVQSQQRADQHHEEPTMAHTGTTRQYLRSLSLLFSHSP